MLFPQLEEKLQASKQALNTATSENIIEQCKQHLTLLAEYRIQLYKLQDLPGVRQQSTPSLSGEVPDREAIREAHNQPHRTRTEKVSFNVKMRRRSFLKAGASIYGRWIFGTTLHWFSAQSLSVLTHRPRNKSYLL